MQSTNGGAVVIGASMAGLLAARVLADRFDQVTVIDRDDLPDGADSRKGVPHGRDEEPAGQIVTHRLPSNQWRHFEKVNRHPCRFLAMGDAICSFNPIYGQGMSSAALQAMALGTCLDRYGPATGGLPRRFYHAAAKVIANPTTGVTHGPDRRPGGGRRDRRPAGAVR